MKQIIIVMSYTFRDGCRKKAFKVSTVIMLILMLVLCALPRIISFFDGADSTSENASDVSPDTSDTSDTEKTDRFYYVDEGRLIPGGAEALAEAFPEADVITGGTADISGYEAEIKSDGSVSAVIISEDESTLPHIEFVTKSFMSGIDTDTAAKVLTDTYMSGILQSAGVDSSVIEIAKAELEYTSRFAGDMNVSGYIMGILMTVLTFFAVYYYGYGVAMSVATEKTSRVMETLVVSAKPSNILIGKCLGMGLLGLAQFAGILVSGVVFYNLLVPEGFTLMGMSLSFDAFTPVSALLLCLYFLLGYALYSVMNAVCGASVSKIEDLNSAMMPVMMIALLSFYVGYFAAISGAASSAFMKAATLIPFCSPFVLPFRLLNETVPAHEIIISLVLLAGTIAAVTAVSIRIYSASVLRYGKRLRLRDSLRNKTGRS